MRASRIGLLAVALAAALTNAGAEEETYRVVVRFGSGCCGPDAKAMDEVRRVLIDQSRALGRPFGEKWVRAGREGEQNLCLSLPGIDRAKQAHVVRRLRSALQGSQNTTLEENAACREWP